MSKIQCLYNKLEKSYLLSFTSKSINFESTFKITCPDNFIYKPVTIYDGFLFGIIFKAMECGENLEIDFPISKQGFQNVNYYIEAWHNLLPDTYKKIKIIASNIVDGTNTKTHPAESISAFSGGVDACFTLIRHNEKDWGENFDYNLKNVLCVQGFDVPINKNKEYDLLMDRVSPIYEQYNCRQFKVWTDLKLASKQDWEMSFSAQLACCLHLFSEHFAQALIGSSEPYKDFFLPWGSTPSTDFLLSGTNLEIIHDGAGFTRTEKAERISKNNIAVDRMKVCWEKGFEDNCGECEKCYRTRLNFLAVGLTDPKCFDSPITLNKIKSIKLNNLGKICEFQSILDYAHKNKITGNWLFSMKLAIFMGKYFHLTKKNLNKHRKKIKKYLKNLIK